MISVTSVISVVVFLAVSGLIKLPVRLGLRLLSREVPFQITFNEFKEPVIGECVSFS